MKRWLIKISLLLVLLAVAAAYLVYNRYDNFLKTPVFSTTPVTLEITKGSHYSDFVQLVHHHQGGGDLWQWKLLARLNPEVAMIKAGEFEITEEKTPRELLDYIASNQVKTYSLTLIEGHAWKTIKPTLAEKGLKMVAADMTDEAIQSALDITAPNLEGQFLPETYQFVKGDSDLSVLQRAHQALKQTLQQAWDGRSESVQLNNPYELLILASIIEKETAVASERTEIAGVFHRRLQQGMKLQTDPTVIYGVGDAYAGDITRKHLDTDTPYNTYTRKGLPPTPIAMASAASIQAAAHPKPGTSLYFVADGKGGHTFSDSYDDHLKAVRHYLKSTQSQ